MNYRPLWDYLTPYNQPCISSMKLFSHGIILFHGINISHGIIFNETTRVLILEIVLLC